MKDQEINKARAVYYNFFSQLFVYSADTTAYLQLISTVDVLIENSLDDTSCEALKRIKAQLDPMSNINLVQEYDNLFHNPFSSTIRTTASFYDEQVESGKKRVQMLDFLAKTRIRRDEKTYTDLEDSVGFIITLMAELLDLVAEGQEQYKTLTHCIFADVLNDFVDEFARDVYEHEDAKIFKDVIIVLQAFVSFERLYLEVSKPTLTKKEAIKSFHSGFDPNELSPEEIARRAKNKKLKQQGPKQEINPDDIAYDVENEV
jgi:TorA maturation chaperone TorD